MLEKMPHFVGAALSGVRPGVEKTVAQADFADVPATIAVQSTAFGHAAPMPVDFTEDGRKVSPPLAWTNVPSGTAEIVLIIEDADSPTPEALVHAIAIGLPGGDGGLPEGALASEGAPGRGIVLGKNSFMKPAYLPPDPPAGHGAHRYVVQVFALGQPLALGDDRGRGAIVKAMAKTVFAKGVLIGTFERP